MTTKYRVWTGDGSAWDGEEHDLLTEAVEAIGRRYGWTDPVYARHCNSGAWSVYETQEDADADEDGAYAPGIWRIECCSGCGVEIPEDGDIRDACHDDGCPMA